MEKTTRCDKMKTGDIFVGRVDNRAWKITGWLKGRRECPHVVALDGSGETDIFAGCAEPFGPFTSISDALEFAGKESK